MNARERPAGLLAVVGALGVVFGDIGTSPLYALRAILGEGGGLDTDTVYGLISTVVWSLLLVVTMLYVGVLLGTANEGEGGLVALLGLLRRSGARARAVTVATVVAMLGAATFLGDSVVTPAISVLSAADEGGRTDVPAADWGLAVAVLGIVLVFRSSEKLASAYGVAVAATILTTVSLYLTLGRAERFSRLRMAAASLGLLVMAAFFVSSLRKIVDGGWAPVGIGVVMFLVMWTWWSGQRRLAAAREVVEGSPRELLDELASHDPPLARTQETAVFLTDDAEVAPFALRTVVEAAGLVPERAVLLSWQVEDTPSAPAHRASVEVDSYDDRYAGVLGVSVTLGYRERLEVQHVLAEACRHDPGRLSGIDPDTATYLLSDSIPRLVKGGGMARWRQRLFLVLDQLATDRVEQLALPRDRAIVIGRELDL